MENVPSFNQIIEKSIIDHWDLDALTDYKGYTDLRSRRGTYPP